MRLPSLRTRPPLPLEVGEEDYQEFTAGTIPVRRVMTTTPIRSCSSSTSADSCPCSTSTWARCAAERRRRRRRLRRDVDRHHRRRDPADGDPARAEDRRPAGTPPAALHGPRDEALMAARRRRVLGLVLHPSRDGPSSSLVGIWVLGPTPARGGLRRILTQAGVPRPATLPRPPSRRRRASPGARKRARGGGKSRARARQRRQRDATRPEIEKRN